MYEGRPIARNIIRRMARGTILKSTHRHDFSVCGCPNGTMVDGGTAYVRWGAVDVSQVERPTEYGDDD